ncbi:STAS domain-containing protein [Amycolatopsis jejuensis]|uniref:STAS domain-containing protein n=1 Tax=Amycolatopsis jejuensis TaxID=330084 RepID=UPI001FE22956|nr:STAS domain-containing protein [Amycolatopsis jejuensis]
MTAPQHIGRPPALPWPDPTGSLYLHVHRPAPGTAVVEAAGEIDLATAPHLAEVVEARLRSTVGLVIVDLRRTTFLAVAGLRILHRLQLRAAAEGADFYVDPGECPTVRRLLSLLPLGCERPGSAEGLTETALPRPGVRHPSQG